MLFCIPLTVLEVRNKMTKWIAKLFSNKTSASDIVRYIRTEFREDTAHLTDEDCLHYYNHITHTQRRT